MARRIWEVLLLLLGIALALWVSESIPHATISRDVGAVVIGLVVALLLVVIWEWLDLKLQSPIARGSQTDSIGPSVKSTTFRSTPRQFTDVTSQFLIDFTKSPNLTGAQVALLLAPYKGLWMPVEGTVEDVSPVDYPNLGGRFTQVTVTIAGASQRNTQAYFTKDLEQVDRLHKGSQVRFVGRFRDVTLGAVQLVDCELKATPSAPAPEPMPISPASPTPVPTATSAPVPVPSLTGAPMQRPREPYCDATLDALVGIAKTPNLTAIQVDSLLAPYKGQWMAVQGVVDDVDRTVGVSSVRVRLSRVNGEEGRTATAWFDRGQERAAALHRGANVHVLGKILNIYGIGMISLDDCELID
jgi:hypothetical protein